MEVQSILVKHGAKKVIIDYEDQKPTQVLFCIELNNELIPFCLPCNYRGVLKAMQKDKKVPKKLLTEEQAIKVSWRIIKNWIEAQMAIVEAELADLAEVFLPYAMTNGGTSSLYESVTKGEIKLLN